MRVLRRGGAVNLAQGLAIGPEEEDDLLWGPKRRVCVHAVIQISFELMFEVVPPQSVDVAPAAHLDPWFGPFRIRIERIDDIHRMHGPLVLVQLIKENGSVKAPVLGCRCGDPGAIGFEDINFRRPTRPREIQPERWPTALTARHLRLNLEPAVDLCPSLDGCDPPGRIADLSGTFALFGTTHVVADGAERIIVKLDRTHRQPVIGDCKRRGDRRPWNTRQFWIQKHRLLGVCHQSAPRALSGPDPSTPIISIEPVGKRFVQNRNHLGEVGNAGCLCKPRRRAVD